MTASVTIENEALRVVVLPSYGARVVSLFDNHARREWMVPGGQSPNVGEDAVYNRDEAVGWDECFPTVSRWDATATGWGRPLRDHGDLWGRPWQVVSASASTLVTAYSDKTFRLSRGLRLEGRVLRVDYRVDNTGTHDLPYLWAQHGLVTVTPRDRIVLPGIDRVASSYLSIGGATVGARSLPWPGPATAFPVALDEVQPASRHIAAKLYASGMPWVAVGHGDNWLKIGWDAGIRHLGIWYNYGAWPAPGDLHHIALEPTSAPADHLGQVVDGPDPATVSAGGSVSWATSFEVMRQNPQAR